MPRRPRVPIGDDAFVVALEAPHAVSAERLGWELRSLAPARLGTTLSVGVAVGRPDECGDAVVLRAGAALTEAKRLGGNVVNAG
jgi:GGDEF domain-containing protein